MYVSWLSARVDLAKASGAMQPFSEARMKMEDQLSSSRSFERESGWVGDPFPRLMPPRAGARSKASFVIDLLHPEQASVGDGYFLIRSLHLVPVYR